MNNKDIKCFSDLLNFYQWAQKAVTESVQVFSQEAASRSHDIHRGHHIKLQKKDHLQERTLLWISGRSRESVKWQQVRGLDITSIHWSQDDYSTALQS